jgi:hypothetical protein
LPQLSDSNAISSFAVPTYTNRETGANCKKTARNSQQNSQLPAVILQSIVAERGFPRPGPVVLAVIFRGYQRKQRRDQNLPLGCRHEADHAVLAVITRDHRIAAGCGVDEGLAGINFEFYPLNHQFPNNFKF